MPISGRRRLTDTAGGEWRGFSSASVASWSRQRMHVSSLPVWWAAGAGNVELDVEFQPTSDRTTPGEGRWVFFTIRVLGIALLYTFGSGIWLALANDIATHYQPVDRAKEQ